MFLGLIIGAICAGADAVYLGGAKFGARAYADNFTEEQLIFCIRYAHLFGRKVYLTVNTLMKDEELQELYAYLLPFYNIHKGTFHWNYLFRKQIQQYQPNWQNPPIL